MRLSIATDGSILEGSKGVLADTWDEAEARVRLADLHDPAVFASPEAFGHLELGAPVLHPWFAELAARCLGLSAADLARVLDDDLAGWEDDVFVTGSYGAVQGGAEVQRRLDAAPGPELERFFAAWGREPRELLLTRLPVLPSPIRRAHPDLDHLYRRVLSAALVVRSNRALDMPEILCRGPEAELQRAVDQLFDNRTTRAPRTDPEGHVLAGLGDLVDGLRGTPALVVALRGAALDVES